MLIGGFVMKSIGLLFLLTSGLVVGVSAGAAPSKASYPVSKHSFTYVAECRPLGKPKFSADVYFSQSYFEHSAYEYDPHLATASMCFIASSGTDYGPYDEQWYLKQPQYIKAFLETLGFDSVTTNEDYLQTARMDSIGLCVGKKQYSDYTVIAVAPRSAGYYSEWANNFHLGDGSKSDYMHEGWYNAANKLINFVGDYITQNQVTGRIKLWMSGFSRGGATTNVAAGLIDGRLDKGEKIFNDKVSLKREDVFAYTFEAPQGANVNSKTIKLPRDPIYGNIWNIINPNDVVPKVAMSEYGFTRFGIDRFITTRFYDPYNFANNRRTYLALYSSINQTDEVTYAADDFQMFGLKVEDFLKILTIIPAVIDMFEGDYGDIRDNTKKNFDGNITTTLFIEELTSNLGNRNNFVKKFQTPLENLMLIMKDEKISNMPSTPLLFLKLLFIAVFNNCLTRLFASEDAIKKEAGSYASRISELLSVFVGPLVSAYWERPNELISIAFRITQLFQNHFPDITLGHMQAQDSYYVDAYNANHSNKINLVPLRNNADFGRMKFFGFNDLGLRLDSKKGKRVVNVEGHVFGKSDIEDCDDEYAVGYYSYITEEKMELFMPINRKYNISMKSYSKKPRHRCEYWAYYQFIALDNSGRKKVQLDHKKDTAYFNSDRFKRDVTIKV